MAIYNYFQQVKISSIFFLSLFLYKVARCLNILFLLCFFFLSNLLIYSGRDRLMDWYLTSTLVVFQLYCSGTKGLYVEETDTSQLKKYINNF
jgi:hypothetical protein